MIIKVDLKGIDVYKRILNYCHLTFNWKLQPRDLDVIAELLYHNHLMKLEGLSEEVRMNNIFNKINRDKLSKKLKMSYHSLANSISRLKKQGFIKDNKLIGVFSKLNIDKKDLTLNIIFNEK